jgi:NTE family protein
LLSALAGRRKVVFVLSGGGSLGAVQIGMLRALVESGIRPDLILGCSVGAINGAGFATDPTLRGVARLERIWRRLAIGQPELMPNKLIPMAVQLARKGQSTHDPQRLQDLLEDELPVDRIEHLRVPFQCVATDLDTARERWFTGGPLIPALMASAALPAVFPAVRIDGRTLIDGGVLTEIHAERALELGATEIYALHVGHLTDRPVPTVQRPFDGALRAYWTARRYRLADDLRRVEGRCEVHLLPAGSTPRLRFDDFTRGPELTEIAYDETRRYLINLAGESDPWVGAGEDRSSDRLVEPAESPHRSAGSETATAKTATAETDVGALGAGPGGEPVDGLLDLEDQAEGWAPAADGGGDGEGADRSADRVGGDEEAPRGDGDDRARAGDDHPGNRPGRFPALGRHPRSGRSRR